MTQNPCGRSKGGFPSQGERSGIRDIDKSVNFVLCVSPVSLAHSRSLYENRVSVSSAVSCKVGVVGTRRLCVNDR